MKTLLFIDIETPLTPYDPKQPPSSHQHYPQIFEIAWIVTDEKGENQQVSNYQVKPRTEAFGQKLQHDLKKLKNIKTNPVEVGNQFLRQTKIEHILTQFSTIANQADAIISHNLDFDLPVILAAFARAGMQAPVLPVQGYCTMKQTKHITRIPYRRTSRGGALWRWPTLDELHTHCQFGPIENAHTAIADVAALVRCFFFVKTRHPEAFALPWLGPA